MEDKNNNTLVDATTAANVLAVIKAINAADAEDAVDAYRSGQVIADVDASVRENEATQEAAPLENQQNQRKTTWQEELEYLAYKLDDANPYQYCVDGEILDAIAVFKAAVEKNQREFPDDLTVEHFCAELLAYSPQLKKKVGGEK